MARSGKIHPPTELEEACSFSQFTNFKNATLLYIKSFDNYKRFISGADTKWQKLTAENSQRGLQDDVTGTGSSAVVDITGQQKAQDLNEMLELIARYVPCYLNGAIVKNSTCLEDVWQDIRKYFGFRRSEVNFMKINAITWEEGERPERLFQRLMSHGQDNLLLKDGKLTYNGAAPVKDEDMSPTAERLIIMRWLDLMHPRLYLLVCRTFAYDLTRMCLTDLQPQIVDSLDSLLEELRNEDAHTSAAYSSGNSRRYVKPQPRRPQQGRPSSSNTFQSQRFTSSKPKFDHRQPPSASHGKPKCPVCIAEDRPYRHTLGECRFISMSEKRQMVNDLSSKISRVEIDDNDEYFEEDFEEKLESDNDDS